MACEGDPKAVTIDENELIAKLNEVSARSDGDIARIIELLLLENHVLTLGQSSGLRRGVEFEFTDFPRFLKLSQEDDVSELP